MEEVSSGPQFYLVYRHYRFRADEPYPSARNNPEALLPMTREKDAAGYDLPPRGFSVGADGSLLVNPHGGLTWAALYLDGELLGAGMAQCCERDNFCYRIGRAIAAGRAWKEYHNGN